MGRYRSDLSERQIRFDLLAGMSMRAVALKYKCSISLIRKIRDDKRLNHNIPPERLCVCCELRPKAKNNRFLCEVCFKGREEDGTDSAEHINNHYKLPEGGWEDIFNP